MKRTKLGSSAVIFLAACALVMSGCGSGEDSLAAYTQGMTALEASNYSAALINFQAAVDEEGRTAEGLRGQGIAYLYLGEYTTAADLFAQAIEAVQYPAQNQDFIEDVYFYQAQAYVEDGQRDKAMTIYNRLLDGKKSGQAYLLRGKLYAEMGKFGQAGQDFQKAIEADGSYEIYLQVYDVYVANNRQADGATFLKDAESRDPSSADDYYQLGRISYELRDFDKAENYLKEAVNQGVESAIMLLGKVYLEDNNLDAARALYNDCLNNADTAAIAYNGLALCDIAEQNYTGALSNIQSGLAVDDASVKEELLFNEVVVYERMHDFSTASTKIREFLASYPTNEAAIRENVFIQSRVTQSSGAVNEADIDWDEVNRLQAEAEEAAAAEAAEASGSGENLDLDGDGYVDDISYDTSGTGYDDTAYYDAYSDGTYDDGTNYDGTYYDGTGTEYYNAGYDAGAW